MQLVPSPQLILATYLKAKELIHGVDVVVVVDVIVDVVVAVGVVVDVDAVTSATFSSPLSPVR